MGLCLKIYCKLLIKGNDEVGDFSVLAIVFMKLYPFLSFLLVSGF